MPPVGFQPGAAGCTTATLGPGTSEALGADGVAENPGVDGVADEAGPGFGRAKIELNMTAPIATTMTSAPPAASSRVLWVMGLSLHGASQASPARRRRVVLSWARAAQSTRSASSTGPGSRY